MYEKEIKELEKLRIRATALYMKIGNLPDFKADILMRNEILLMKEKFKE